MVRGLRKGMIYWLSQLLGRHILWSTQQIEVIRPAIADRDGPFILALSHLSHLDPILLSAVVRRRPIDWMARLEFFHYRLFAWYLNAIHAICVRRFGVSANAIRTAIQRLEQGRIIGICPDGRVAQGTNSILRGAPMKRGIALISIRSGVPILPCIILGTDRLNCVPPWIPFRRSRLYVAYGNALINPPRLRPGAPRCERRAARSALAEELSRQFQALLKESLDTFGLPEGFVP